MISYTKSVQRDDTLGRAQGSVQVVLTYYHSNGNGDKRRYEQEAQSTTSRTRNTIIQSAEADRGED